MKSHALLLSAAALMMAAGAKASPVDHNTAMRTAREFLASRGCNKNITASDTHRASRSMSESSFTPYYIFNVEDDGGYVVISADDRARTVLAYSDSGSLNKENMPEACALWLNQYAAEIASLAENEATADAVATYVTPYADTADAVAPLLTSRWDQGAPYNDQCPMDATGGKRCVTGCVATAMAQVMYYHRHPASPTGVVTYEDNGVTRTLDFATIPAFDWANMTDTYSSSSTTAQRDAVATLMKAAGYGVGMNYSPDTSIALFNKIGPALVNHFGYDSNLHTYDRTMMSTEEWAQILREELSAGRPVLYDGRNNEAGHTFVCDGYDSNGLFHFNWGWSGLSDGYFSLTALNPGQQSTGGSNSGYNMYNLIICNIRPAGEAGSAPQTDHMLSVYNLWLGNESGYVEANKTPTMTCSLNNARLYFISINHGYIPFEGETWAATVSDDGTITPIVQTYCPIIAPGENRQLVFELFKSGLTDGTYKIGFYYRVNGSEEWHRITTDPSAPSECIATVSGNEITLQPVVRDASTLMIRPSNGLNYLTFDRNDKSLQIMVSTTVSLTWHGDIYGFMTDSNDNTVAGQLHARTSVKGMNNRITLTNEGVHPEAGNYFLKFYADAERRNLISSLAVKVSDKQSGIEDVIQDSALDVTVTHDGVTIVSANEVESITLTDISGRRQPVDPVMTGNSVEISTSHLPAGIYVVSVRTASGRTASAKVAIR